MTARRHETIRVGLRRIIRDQSVRPNTLSTRKTLGNLILGWQIFT